MDFATQRSRRVREVGLLCVGTRFSSRRALNNLSSGTKNESRRIQPPGEPGQWRVGLETFGRTGAGSETHAQQGWLWLWGSEWISPPSGAAAFEKWDFYASGHAFRPDALSITFPPGRKTSPGGYNTTGNRGSGGWAWRPSVGRVRGRETRAQQEGHGCLRNQAPESELRGHPVGLANPALAVAVG